MSARAGAAVLLAVLVLAPSAGADGRASRTVDRTYTCAPGFLGGIYQVQLEMRGRVHDPSDGDMPAYGELTTTPNWRLAGLTPQNLDVSSMHCNRQRKPGALIERGLHGGQVGGLGRIVDCETPARLVVRLRGVFSRPTDFRPHQIFDLRFLRAEGAGRELTIALSTSKGRPIATARIENGKAYLFTSANCEED